MKDAIFITDFYVLNVRNFQTRLGHPFLEMARDQIDCDTGKPIYQSDRETMTLDLPREQEQPLGFEFVDFKDNKKQVVKESLPQGKIEDEGDWAEHMPMSKEVPKALEAEEEKYGASCPCKLLTSAWKMRPCPWC